VDTFNQIIFFIDVFYIYFNKNQTYIMSKIYQPIVIERTKEIIETLIETNFFLDYDIGVTDFAKNHISDMLTEKFINGDTDLTEDEIFNEDEFENLLREIVDGTILNELKTKGIVNSYEDDNTEEMFFLTEKGKKMLKSDEKLK